MYVCLSKILTRVLNGSECDIGSGYDVYSLIVFPKPLGIQALNSTQSAALSV